MVSWRDIAFIPDAALASEIGSAWHWIIGDGGCSPFLCSMLGDVFFERSDGVIDWLSCSGGSAELAAPSRQAFDAICHEGGEQVDLWFGPAFVARLLEAGKQPSEGQCYFFLIQPVFAECRYEPNNIAVTSATEVFVGLADMHRQMAELPDGEKVQMRVVD